MSDIVVDSSVIAKWALVEVDSGKAKRLLVEAPAAGRRLIVLDLALVEAGNAIWKQCYRGEITIDETRECLDLLFSLPVFVEQALPLLPKATELALKYRHAVYDALFVALMQELGVEGVTADEALYAAVRADQPHIVRLRDWS